MLFAEWALGSFEAPRSLRLQGKPDAGMGATRFLSASSSPSDNLRALTNTTCLVTGGTGFLGRHLLACLRRRTCEMRVLTRRAPEAAADILGPGVEPWHGDIRNAHAVRKALDGIRVVFHAAGEKRSTDTMMSVNIDGTRTLLEACKDAGVPRVIHISSAGVVGRPSGLVVSEDTPYSPCDEYERTKQAAETLALDFGRREGLAVTVVRPVNVFGDMDPETHLLTLMRLIRRQRFRFVGGRSGIVNYAYAGDVAEACWALVGTPESPGQIYIVSDSCTLEEFVTAVAEELRVAIPRGSVPLWLAYAAAAASDAVSRILRRPLPLTVEKVRTGHSRIAFSAERLRRTCPTWPMFGWREGLRRTVAWYRSLGML